MSTQDKKELLSSVKFRSSWLTVILHTLWVLLNSIPALVGLSPFLKTSKVPYEVTVPSWSSAGMVPLPALWCLALTASILLTAPFSRDMTPLYPVISMGILGYFENATPKCSCPFHHHGIAEPRGLPRVSVLSHGGRLGLLCSRCGHSSPAIA
jgi:hypothetical protein